MLNLISFRLETVLVLAQDRCTICVERTIGSKSFWMHPTEILGDMSLVESHFFLFGDSVSIGVR
jgi:hypothetical protein